MHDRDIQKVKAIRSKSPIDWATFKKYRNSVNDDIKNAKQLYYNNAFYENEKNNRKTWSIINELTSRKQRDTRISEITLNGRTIGDSSRISQKFNNHFASIGPKLAAEIPCNNDTCRSHLEYINCADPSDNFSL